MQRTQFSYYLTADIHFIQHRVEYLYKLMESGISEVSDVTGSVRPHLFLGLLRCLAGVLHE